MEFCKYISKIGDQDDQFVKSITGTVLRKCSEQQLSATAGDVPAFNCASTTFELVKDKQLQDSLPSAQEDFAH